MSETPNTAVPYFVGAMTGRYVLDGQTRLPGINIFACRVRSISPDTMVATAPVIGSPGDIITAWLPVLGTINGRIARHTADGFVVDIVATTLQRSELAERIEAYRSRAWTGANDKRSHHRHMPADPRSIILENGGMTPCLIVDFSPAGAAISAAAAPAIGAQVIIGQIAATVVRHFDVGFAVRFTSINTGDDTEDLLQAPEEWRSAVIHAHPAIDTTDASDPPELYGYVY